MGHTQESKLNTLEISLYILSNTLGYFIFILPFTLGKLRNIQTNGDSSLFNQTWPVLIIPLAALLLIPTVFSYSQLGKMFPNGYGDGTYLKEINWKRFKELFGNENRAIKTEEQPFSSSFLANLFVFSAILLELPCFSSVSINLITSAISNDHKVLITILLLIGLFALNLFSSRLSIRIQNFLSALRMVFFVIFILLVLFSSFGGSKNDKKEQIRANKPQSNTFAAIPLFARAILWSTESFDGFTSANFISGRIKTQNLLKSMLISILFVVFFYGTVSFAFLADENFTKLSSEDCVVFLDTYLSKISQKKILKVFGRVLIILPVLGILNGCLIIMKSLVRSVTEKNQTFFQRIYRQFGLQWNGRTRNTENLMFVCLSFVIFLLSFVNTAFLLDKLGCFVNFWHILSVSTLVMDAFDQKRRAKTFQSPKETASSMYIIFSGQENVQKSDENKKIKIKHTNWHVATYSTSIFVSTCLFVTGICLRN